jgi:hypothetical protein
LDKTTNKRQKRFREQIAKGEKKRLQIVINRKEAEKLDEICAVEGINKTEFIRLAIEQWDSKEICEI